MTDTTIEMDPNLDVNLENLPEDVIVEIAHRLDYQNIVKMCRVNPYFDRKICGNTRVQMLASYGNIGNVNLRKTSSIKMFSRIKDCIRLCMIIFLA